MTADPFVALVFFASVGLLIVAVFAFFGWQYDRRERRRSRALRRRINRYGI